MLNETYPDENYQQGYQDYPPPNTMGWARPPMPPPPSSDFFTKRLDGSDILEMIELQLRGKVKDTDGRVKTKWGSLCNEEGIGLILSCVANFGLNKNIFLGNITREEINNRCVSIWKEMALAFYINYYHYGITRENRGLIIKMVVYAVHSALSRSEEGKEAEEISVATNRIENVTIAPEQKGRSLLNPFSYFGKGSKK